jgi:hypothetical protein
MLRLSHCSFKLKQWIAAEDVTWYQVSTKLKLSGSLRKRRTNELVQYVLDFDCLQK